MAAYLSVLTVGMALSVRSTTMDLVARVSVAHLFPILFFGEQKMILRKESSDFLVSIILL